jgi:non-heme chloroperoxidase
VLVIQGDADTSAPIDLTGRRSADLLQDGRLVVPPGAGRGLYTSDAPRYNAELMTFIPEPQVTFTPSL